MDAFASLWGMGRPSPMKTRKQPYSQAFLSRALTPDTHRPMNAPCRLPFVGFKQLSGLFGGFVGDLMKASVCLWGIGRGPRPSPTGNTGGKGSHKAVPNAGNKPLKALLGGDLRAFDHPILLTAYCTNRVCAPFMGHFKGPSP